MFLSNIQHFLAHEQDITDTDYHPEVLKVSPDRVAEIYEKACVGGQCSHASD